MSFFSDLIKSANPISWIGSAVGGIGSLIAGNQANKAQAHIADRQIAAQREMNDRNIAFQREANAANIASQEKINQQNIDFQQGVNDLMRHDSLHAISNKRDDLMRAGYSTADPSLSGFSSATLSSPSLTAPQVTAPQVQSEFPSEAAANSILAKNSVISNLSTMANTLTDIALKRAMTDKTKSETEGLKKSNAWIDLEKDAAYSLALQSIENAVKDGTIKDYIAQDMANDLATFSTRFDLLKEELAAAKTNNKYLEDKLFADITHVNSLVANIDIDTSNKMIHEQILGVEHELKKIEKKFAEYGIDFHSSDLVSSIAKLAISGKSSEVVKSVIQSIKDIFATLTEEAFPVTEKVVDGGKKFVKSVIKSNQSPNQHPTSNYYRSLGRGR